MQRKNQSYLRRYRRFKYLEVPPARRGVHKAIVVDTSAYTAIRPRTYGRSLVRSTITDAVGGCILPYPRFPSKHTLFPEWPVMWCLIDEMLHVQDVAMPWDRLPHPCPKNHLSMRVPAILITNCMKISSRPVPVPKSRTLICRVHTVDCCKIWKGETVKGGYAVNAPGMTTPVEVDQYRPPEQSRSGRNDLAMGWGLPSIPSHASIGLFRYQSCRQRLKT